jgi:hypothetical protein
MNMSFGIYYKASSVFKWLDWLSIKEKKLICIITSIKRILIF